MPDDVKDFLSKHVDWIQLALLVGSVYFFGKIVAYYDVSKAVFRR